MRSAFGIAAVVLLSACGNSDPNGKPLYGSSGLPVNCRAYVQTVINGYRGGTYSAEDSMDGLERNCGINGQIWGLTD